VLWAGGLQNLKIDTEFIFFFSEFSRHLQLLELEFQVLQFVPGCGCGLRGLRWVVSTP